jgi:hypothetical protein
MQENLPLSQRLRAHGLFCALGSTETHNNKVVGRGEPYSWDRNNGIIVIHDEDGWPWVQFQSCIRPGLYRINHYPSVEIELLCGSHKLKRGGYVPHSNDGGQFIGSVLPELLRRVET